MTECMPVTCPPFAEPLGKPGSVGVSVGPEVVIFSADGKERPRGVTGKIMIRGASLFAGYLV